MAAWTADELAKVEAADELDIAARRPDGTLRKPVTIWVVRVGDELYVRSAYGPDSAWYRAAKAATDGRVRAGGVEKDVAFEDAGHDLDDEVDAAYSEKYRRYTGIVDTMLTSEVRATTIRLVPLR
jgi:hypothetical protein